jgi:hypothetical protein
MMDRVMANGSNIPPIFEPWRDKVSAVAPQQRDGTETTSLSGLGGDLYAARFPFSLPLR